MLFKSSRLPKDPNQGKNDIGINVEKHDDSRVINISITIPESSRTKMIRVKQTRDKPKRDGNSPV
ncbi:hypothetical protein EON65_16285 [archaeon]|nr:MAG: hypothetical protein EON65_16285 [archaeon]